MRVQKMSIWDRFDSLQTLVSFLKIINSGYDFGTFKMGCVFVRSEPDILLRIFMYYH